LSCPACAAAEPAPWRWGLARCPLCGTAVTLAGAPAFGDAYDTPPPRLARAAAPVLAAFDRRRLALLSQVAGPPGPLLDVGAGRGRFVAAARAAGWEARGLEPSGRARGVPGIEQVALQGAQIAAGSLGAATLWHVLEHLDDPAAALARVAGWLRPGGGLLVGVPNLASWQARAAGAHWYHLDLPRHRVHFTALGLRALLARGGFGVVGEHHVLAEHNPYGMWQSAVSRVAGEPSWLWRWLRREAAFDARAATVSAAAAPLAPLAAGVELAAGLARSGGTVAFTAVRQA
jgi:SAM-dependent methyltransferase